MKAFGYLRVSTDRQAHEDRTSLSDQRAALEALAAARGYAIARWFEDAGVSGATAEKRPAFMAMVDACRTDGPGVVLVLNASRFGRFDDVEEAAYWRHSLRRAGWEVRYAEGDAEGDAAPIVRAVASLEASTYRRNLIANTRRGKKGAADQGFWSTRAPIGYRRQVVSTGRILGDHERKAPDEKVRLAIHPEEGELVRWIYDSYVSGEHTLGTLSAALLERVPGRRWSRTVVNHLLRNPVYRGAVVGGRRRNGPSILYGKEHAHPAIVPDALWHAVQARLELHAKRGRGVRSFYLLSGLLTCRICASNYTGGGGRSGVRQKFYRDAASSETCPGRIGTVMRHLIEGRVLAELGAVVAGPEMRADLERAADEILAEGLRARTGQSKLQAERRHHEQRKARLVAAIADGSLSARDAARQIQAEDRAIEEARRKIEATRFRSADRKQIAEERDHWLRLASDFPGVAARLAGPALREFVTPWLAHLTFDKLTRMVEVGVRPGHASFLASSSPEPTGRLKGGLILRRTLVRPVGARRAAHG
ncbi:MAG: recombinase family protein [Vicinamibacterales bacterium]